MKKTLSKLQIILSSICASALFWLIIYELFKLFDIILKPFTVLWISFMILLGVSIAINYLNKK